MVTLPEAPEKTTPTIDRAAPSPSPVGAVRVLSFAGARDIVGASEIEVGLHAPCTASELLDRLCEQFPALGPHKRSLRVAINGTYAFATDPVAAGDEVALIPPVAGG